MNITDSAVEAAARALALDQTAEVWISEQEWDGIMPDRYKEPYRRLARLALEAGVPFLPCCKGCPECKGIIGETGIL